MSLEFHTSHSHVVCFPMSFNIFELFEKPKSFGIQEALNSNLTESFLWLWSGGQGIDHPLNFSLSGFPDHAGDVNLNLKHA